MSDSAAAAFAAQIQRGVTVTYDVGQGQADMALGALRLGETPRRVFEDGTAWIENTRLLLPAGAAHVFGPLEPLPIDVDVAVSAGAVCQNVYLFCASAGLVTVARGWFDRGALAEALALSEGQQIVLAQTVGYPA